jgi:hypothetical protein
MIPLAILASFLRGVLVVKFKKLHYSTRQTTTKRQQNEIKRLHDALLRNEVVTENKRK